MVLLRRREREQRELKLKVMKALLLVRSHIARLNLHIHRLERRKSLAERWAREALLLGEREAAGKLDEELRYVDGILATLIKVKYVLERASLRLETAAELGAVRANLLPVKTALAKLREEGVTAMPEIGAMLTEVDNALSEILAVTRGLDGEGYGTVPAASLSEEARRIMEEAEGVAKKASRHPR